MPVVISKTPNEPYDLVNVLSPLKTEGNVYETKSFTTTDVVENLYVIISLEDYPSLYLNVENEVGSGMSLWISDVNLDDTIVGWVKKLKLTNMNAASQNDKTIVKKIKIKWSLINNIFILKDLNGSANINVYDTEN